MYRWDAYDRQEEEVTAAQEFAEHSRKLRCGTRPLDTGKTALGNGKISIL